MKDQRTGHSAVFSILTRDDALAIDTINITNININGMRVFKKKKKCWDCNSGGSSTAANMINNDRFHQRINLYLIQTGSTDY